MKPTLEVPEDVLEAALVLVERYGLDGKPPRSLADVAERHGVTRLEVRMLEMKDDRFIIENRIVSERLNDVATEGQGVLVAFHYPSGKKTTLPEDLKTRIMALEATVRKE